MSTGYRWLSVTKVLAQGPVRGPTHVLLNRRRRPTGRLLSFFYSLLPRPDDHRRQFARTDSKSAAGPPRYWAGQSRVSPLWPRNAGWHGSLTTTLHVASRNLPLASVVGSPTGPSIVLADKGPAQSRDRPASDLRRSRARSWWGSTAVPRCGISLIVILCVLKLRRLRPTRYNKLACREQPPAYQ